MAVCPLDKSHIVEQDSLREHIEMCSSIGKAADMDIGNIEARDPDPPSSLYLNENWEEDPEFPHYDPMEASAKMPVLRCVPGLTKAEKKKFRDNERERIANLKGFPSTVLESANMTCEAPLHPLRPPRNASTASEDAAASQATAASTSILQNDFDKMKIHEDEKYDSDDRNTGARPCFAPNIHDSSFHRMLYDELAPKDDEIKQLEQSLRNTNSPISLKDYFQQVTRENGNFSISNQKKKRTEVESKKTGMDSTFSIDMKKGKDESIENTSSASKERVTDTLLALLQNESSAKKQSMNNTVKIDQINKSFGVKGPVLDKIFDQFTERLAYLNDIQSTAAEESARLSQQLKDLKELRDQMASRK